MLDSIQSLIKVYDVGEDKTHFSIVTYAGDAEIRVSLDDPKYHSNEALEDLLDEMKEKDKLGSPTRTDKALKLVSEKVFVAQNGDRTESPNIMMVFTDGKTHKNSEPYDETIIPKLEVRTNMLRRTPEHTLKLDFETLEEGRINYGKKSEWSPIRSVFIRVINKNGRPRSGSPICLSLTGKLLRLTSPNTQRTSWSFPLKRF